MPKGNSPKLKGALCSIPIDVVDVCNTHPRPADSNGIIIVKLKTNLQYRGHVYFESARPYFVLKFLQYLDNIPSFLINEKNQDSLSFNVLNNINTDDEIPLIGERNGSHIEEVESDIHSISISLLIPILVENCDNN